MQEIFDIFEKNYNNKSHLKEGLYIIPTPIGNLEDITIRALNVLKRCDVILCEDTRITGNLLKFYKIDNKKLYIYNDHSNEEQRNKILELLLSSDKTIGLVSDAGTPLISDPGYKLVYECKMHGIDVIPLTGSSASITALSASGISSDKFLFYGFLSPKIREKTKELEDILNNRYTTICYETANRLLSTLEIILNFDKNRKVCVARELTKLYEDIKTDSIIEVYSYYKDNLHKLKGEIVLIIEKETQNNKSLDLNISYDNIKKYLKFLNIKDCSSLLSELYNLNKKDIYKKLLEVKDEE